MNRRILTIVSALALAASSVACSRHAETDAAPEGCSGRRNAAVSNNWSEPVEVFYRQGSSPVRNYLGTVRAGMRELYHLPDGVRFVQVSPVGGVAPPGQTVSFSELVDVRYLCE